MHEELKERLLELETDFNGNAFQEIISRVKKEKINDEGLLEQISKISEKRFYERFTFTFNVLAGNVLWIIITAGALVLALRTASNIVLYFSALILMTSLHPLSHYLTGRLVGIKFLRYYLNGPARIEPTLKIDYFSYLKTPGKKRALMHASGVIGTVLAPLIVAGIALNKGANEAAGNLFILFLLLIIFELFTSTKIGDLMRAIREYRYE